MRNYKELIVWQKAHLVILDVYKLTTAFPDNEKFGLTSQLRRSSSSIGLNISEGAGRYTDKDFAYFLNIALGSANETDYCCLLAKDLGFIKETEYEDIKIRLGEIIAMLISLIKKVRN